MIIDTFISIVPLLRPLSCLPELLPPVANHPPFGVLEVVVEEAAVVVPLVAAAAVHRPNRLVEQSQVS